MTPLFKLQYKTQVIHLVRAFLLDIEYFRKYGHRDTVGRPVVLTLRFCFFFMLWLACCGMQHLMWWLVFCVYWVMYCLLQCHVSDSSGKKHDVTNHMGNMQGDRIFFNVILYFVGQRAAEWIFANEYKCWVDFLV